MHIMIIKHTHAHKKKHLGQRISSHLSKGSMHSMVEDGEPNTLNGESETKQHKIIYVV